MTEYTHETSIFDVLGPSIEDDKGAPYNIVQNFWIGFKSHAEIAVGITEIEKAGIDMFTSPRSYSDQYLQKKKLAGDVLLMTSIKVRQEILWNAAKTTAMHVGVRRLGIVDFYGIDEDGWPLGPFTKDDLAWIKAEAGWIMDRAMGLDFWKRTY
jgi:hypothetical protein